MKTIYIDNDYMCHLTHERNYKMVETNAFNHILDEAIPFYRFVPKGCEYNGVKCGDDFVQCVNSKGVDRIQNEYEIIKEHKRQALIEAGVILPTDKINF